MEPTNFSHGYTYRQVYFPDAARAAAYAATFREWYAKGRADAYAQPRRESLADVLQAAELIREAGAYEVGYTSTP